MMRHAVIAAATLLTSAWLATAGAAEALTADKVSAEIADRYHVTVLRVTPTKLGDRAAFAVLVMNPGGDENNAFQVSTLLVDAATGALLPQFAHRNAGYTLPPASDRSPPANDSGPAIRYLTGREYRVR